MGQGQGGHAPGPAESGRASGGSGIRGAVRRDTRPGAGAIGRRVRPGHARASLAAADAVAFFAPAAPVVHPARILRIQGYSERHRIRPAIVRAAERMAELAPVLGAPSAAYVRVPVCGLHGEVLELPGGVQLHCKAFEHRLDGCTEVIAFALTAGPGLDARVIELAQAGDLLEALLLETTGWLCIEDATRQFKVHLRAEALRRGHRITARMGPGYSYKVGNETCLWPLEEQNALFGLFGDAELPVSVMGSGAMQPKMSRSGLFGAAPRIRHLNGA